MYRIKFDDANLGPQETLSYNIKEAKRIASRLMRAGHPKVIIAHYPRNAEWRNLYRYNADGTITDMRQPLDLTSRRYEPHRWSVQRKDNRNDENNI